MYRLDTVERAAVEAIRNARTIRIIIDDGTNNEQHFFAKIQGDASMDFRRNIRLAVQEYAMKRIQNLQPTKINAPTWAHTSRAQE